MPTSNSRLAFEDCFEILDIASEDNNGARVQVPAHSDAMQLRTRLHVARRIDRDENAKTYDKDHPLHGKSIYDRLVVRLKTLGDDHFVYVERVQRPTKIEPLSEVEAPALEPPRPMKLLEPPAKEVIVQRILRRA